MLKHPDSIFIDCSSDALEWKEDVESLLLSRLAKLCNKNIIPQNVYPWGCSEFNYKYVNMYFDIVW